MDPAALAGFITGAAGLATAAVTKWVDRKSKLDDQAMAYVQLALERQDLEIARGSTERATQDLKIEQLENEVRECHKEKGILAQDLIEERRRGERQEQRIATQEQRIATLERSHRPPSKSWPPFGVDNAG